MSKKDKDLKVDVIAIHGFLNEAKTKALATISYNDADPKLNIRSCWQDKTTGELRMGSGISLSDDEADALAEFLSDRKHGQLGKVDKSGRKAVNFGNIFSTASDIVEKRDAGYTTEDGFIRLTKRPGVKIRRDKK